MQKQTDPRIEITTETLDLIFHGFGNDLGNNYGVYDTSKEEKIRDNEDHIKAQILSALKLQKIIKKTMSEAEKSGELHDYECRQDYEMLEKFVTDSEK